MVRFKLFLESCLVYLIEQLRHKQLYCSIGNVKTKNADNYLKVIH
jgi:hypothetical protein